MVGAEGFEASIRSDHIAFYSVESEGKPVQNQRFPKFSGVPLFPYSPTDGSNSARIRYHWYHPSFRVNSKPLPGSVATRCATEIVTDSDLDEFELLGSEHTSGRSSTPGWACGMRELRRLRDENGRLKRIVADLTLNPQILQKIVSTSCRASPEASAGELGAGDV